MLALANVPILPISKDGCLFADGVPIFERFPLFIGDDEAGMAAAGALGARKALVHKGHGAIIVGGTIEQATVTTMVLERAAQAQWHAMAVGRPVQFSERDAARYLNPDAHDCVGLFHYFALRLSERLAQAVP